MWIVADLEINLSTTVITLFRDSLMNPDATGI